ncbi:YadA-like family protein [Neisseria sp. HMSC074B07]|uniref:YadA C-terminal domain-containing protein n=2 Tax=Neisseria sp. HMSC074B07 TaxID=1715205 RepID=UPI0008A12F81|nr:YadA-like family protein [Neisseria sp. HMSC074B07]OFL95737.1 outer membrane insertion C- signal [Neisseria sp. HMSC074B07]
MKKFNVKALSLAVAAAVVSGAAAAEEVNFAQAVTEKNQGKAAFFTVFGEGTTFDKDTGKLTFKKDSDALLLKTLELEQTINGFASGSNFITTDANGKKTVRKATNEDIEADSLKGVGLAGGLTAVNARVDKLAEETSAALDDQDETIEELKTAITTNGTRIAEVATGVNDLNKSVTKMGEDISSKFDEVDSEISKASSELSESIEKVSEDVTAVNTRVDSLAQDTADAKAAAKAAEDKVTALSANVDSKVTEAKDAAKAAEDKVTALSANIDSKVKEAKDAAANAVDAASKIDAVAEKADKANKAVDELAERAALSIAENAQQIDGFKEGDEIVVTDADGVKSVKKATKEDVEQDEFGGLGLKEVVAQHDQSFADLTAETERAKKAAEQAAFAAIENAQELNGFKEKDEIIVTDDNGVKSVKTATEEDVKADEFKGLGLKEAVKDTHKAAAQATLAAIENAQELNGFQEGDQIVVTKDDGSKVIRTATKEDVENADFEGMGLKEVVAAHDETLDGLNKAVTENSEALVKTAAVVNDISADVNANKAALEEQKEANEGFNNAIASLDEDISTLKKVGLAAAGALEANRQDIDANKAAIDKKADKADFEELAKYTADMGKKVNDIGDEVTSLSDATTTAVARIDEDIVTLKKAGLTAADALEANRQDIDANKAAIDKKADKADFEELAKYTADMGKKVNDIGDTVTELGDSTKEAIAAVEQDIVTLKKVGLNAADALEANRQDIDANKAAIEKKADKADFEELAKYTADMGKKVNDIGDTVTELGDSTKEAIAAVEQDIVTLKKVGLNAADALEANRQDIDANKAAIAENTAAIDKKADKADIELVKKAAVEAEKSAKSVQGSVEVAQKSAETAESHAKAAKTSADAANNVASAAQTAAAQAQDAVKANAAQVEANKANIATLQTASNQHAAGIAKNSARIDSLDKNVANLRKETRQGLAAQAALSGLFQPYSVGKFNVTAALGGFKSDTAVAVGAGYRFNENFAAKAGLAVGTSSGGSASYNVGVNYEW